MSIGSTQPFWPAGTVVIAAGASSANITLVGGGEAVLIFNASASVAFVKFGTDLTVTATTADMPIPAGARMLIHSGAYARTAAALLSAGTGSVYLTRGNGTVY